MIISGLPVCRSRLHLSTILRRLWATRKLSRNRRLGSLVSLVGGTSANEMVRRRPAFIWISGNAGPARLSSLSFLNFRGRVFEVGDELLELGVRAKVFHIVVGHHGVGILLPAIDCFL